MTQDKQLPKVSERTTEDLLELVCQLSGRFAMYDTKELFDAYWEARNEMNRRIEHKQVGAGVIIVEDLIDYARMLQREWSWKNNSSESNNREMERLAQDIESAEIFLNESQSTHPQQPISIEAMADEGYIHTLALNAAIQNGYTDSNKIEIFIKGFTSALGYSAGDKK